MKYDAIAIDAQTVRSNSFHFDGGLLGQLRQFRHSTIDVLISQMVGSEILKHLRELTRQSKQSLQSASKRARELGIEHPPFDLKEIDTDKAASMKLAEFIDAIGAEIVQVDRVKVGDLMRSYFEGHPPFSEKKKDEFPDAITLPSLEAWAKSQSKMILAVSGDDDWKNFAKSSKYIDVVSTLDEAIPIFQSNTVHATTAVWDYLSTISDHAEEVAKFRYLLDDELGAFHAYGYADSIANAETEEVYLALGNFEIPKEEAGANIKIIASGRSMIAAQIEVSISAVAEATFSLSIRDSIDKDYVYLGRAPAKVTVNSPGEILITLARDSISQVWRLDTLELLEFSDEIDFGYVQAEEEEWYEDY